MNDPATSIGHDTRLDGRTADKHNRGQKQYALSPQAHC
jgi:hypothetical protein